MVWHFFILVYSDLNKNLIEGNLTRSNTILPNLFPEQNCTDRHFDLPKGLTYKNSLMRLRNN